MEIKFNKIDFDNSFLMNSDELKELDYLQNQIVEQQIIQIEKFVENILRNHVHPVIKGEITKGKIRWRGITILNDINAQKVYVNQRGIDIPIVLDYSLEKSWSNWR